MKYFSAIVIIFFLFSCGERIFLEPGPDVVYTNGTQYIETAGYDHDKAVFSGNGRIYEFFRCGEYDGNIEIMNIKESGNYKMFIILEADTVFSRTVYLYKNIRNDLKITALDVSQGDCFIVDPPDSDPSVIDGGYGSSGSYYWQDGGSKTLLNHLKSTERTVLDLIIETHHDLDHYGGLEDLVSSGDINFDKYLDYNSEELPPLGDTLFFSEQVKGVMLHYGNIDEDPGTEENDRSISFLLIYRDFEMIFTGDIGDRAEELILSRQILDPVGQYEILKVPHHGSSSSSTEQFLEITGSRCSLISAGEGNPWGHPDREVLERIGEYSSEIYRTDRCGNIEICSDGNVYSVSYLK